MRITTFAGISFLCAISLTACRSNTTYKIPTRENSLVERTADPTEQAEFEQNYRDFANSCKINLLSSEETQILPVLSGYQSFLTLLAGSEGDTYNQVAQVLQTNAPDEYSLVQGFNGLIRTQNIEKSPQEKTPTQVGSSFWMIWPILVEPPFAEEMAARIRTDVVRLGSTGITAQNAIQNWLDQFLPQTVARKPGLTRENPIINLGVTQITASFELKATTNSDGTTWQGDSADGLLTFSANSSGKTSSQQTPMKNEQITSKVDFTELIRAAKSDQLITGPNDFRNMSIDLIPQADPAGVAQMFHSATIHLSISGSNPFAQSTTFTFEIKDKKTRLPLILGKVSKN
ncbi:hypothetical protein CCB80_03615 [Armatimonadetes bacterium Uphvl-Ar1]|nr:hypothetical protein CCB80_03615 [Armatimonadetes bacterium Uphvl-Ar1]